MRGAIAGNGTGLYMYECTYRHWELVRELRNEAREGFLSQNTISEVEHMQFMCDNWKNYFVCCSRVMEFLGFCGVVDGDIRVAVTEEARGQGVGKFMIGFLSEKYPEAFARVKVDNEASLRLFESCGFKKTMYVLEKD